MDANYLPDGRHFHGKLLIQGNRVDVERLHVGEEATSSLWRGGKSEVRFYKIKISRIKERKHAYDQEKKKENKVRFKKKEREHALYKKKQVLSVES